MHRTALLQRFVDLRFGKGRVRPESNFLALRLLTLDLRRRQFVPVFGAVDIARTQLRRQAVPVPPAFLLDEAACSS